MPGGDHVLPVPPVAQGHQEGGTLVSYGCGGISHRFVKLDFDRFKNNFFMVLGVLVLGILKYVTFAVLYLLSARKFRCELSYLLVAQLELS